MPAMRPHKLRYIDGIQLVANLYSDPRGRPGFYSYRRADGSKKTFQAASVEKANAIASQANALRDKDLAIERPVPARDQMVFHTELYIEYRQHISPELRQLRSWNNRRYALQLFAGDFPQLNQLTLDRLRTWWDGQSYHQQKLRMAEFRRFFNWLMGQGLAPRLKFNPFTTADDLPRLLLKSKPKKQRRPLSQDGYRKIYAAAGKLGYECLQLAMAISRYTTLREGDICALRWERNIVDGQLRVVVSKSEAQKGSARASRLAWDLADHPVLKAAVDRARELSLVNRRCPFVISHEPKRRVWNEDKAHLHQVTADRLSRLFREARDAAGIEGTSFHEVRGLSSTLYKMAGYTTDEIRELMAHESINTTLGYQDAGALPFQVVQLRLAK